MSPLHPILLKYPTHVLPIGRNDTGDIPVPLLAGDTEKTVFSVAVFNSFAYMVTRICTGLVGNKYREE